MFASVYESPEHKMLTKPLSEPLLDLDDTEVSYDDDDNVDEELAITESGVSFCLSDNEDDNLKCESLLAVIVLPILLLVQFDVPHYSNYNSASTTPFVPPLATIVSSIALFAMSSVLYKYSLRITSSYNLSPSRVGMIVQLLPELWANAVLGTITVSHDLSVALHLMLVGNLVLGASSIWRGIRAYRELAREENEKEQLDMC